MGFRNQIEKGTRHDWARRLNFGGFPAQFSGARKQGVSNPPNKPRSLENARITSGGPITERPGQAKDLLAMASAVAGIFDPTLHGFAAAWVPPLAVTLANGVYQVTGNTANGDWFSRAIVPTSTDRIALPATGIATFARPFLTRGKLVIGTIYASFGADIYLYQWSPADGVTEALVFTTDFPDTSYPGNGFSCGVEFDGNFYFSVWYDISPGVISPPPNHLLIYRWDGVNAPVLEVDYIVISPAAGIFNTWALYSDGFDVFAVMLPAAFAGGSTGLAPGNIIKKRNGGTWNTLTMPGGCTYFGAAPRGNAGVSYGSVVRYNGATYIAGHDQSAQAAFSTRTLKILKWDGAALTTVWSHVNTAWQAEINLFVADGVLYYNYSDSNAPLYRTGSFDGATWNDTAKVWTDAPQSLSLIPINVVDFDGELWASLGESQILRRTVGRNVLGTWIQTTGDIDNANYLDSVAP